MEQARVTLHTHERTASGDSETPAATLAEEYARRGVDFVGFVGHDDRPHVDFSQLPIEGITGIEHEIQTAPRVHIVEFPEYDFSFLAHPAMTYTDNVGKNAVETAREHGVDAIEAYSRGEEHLPGDSLQDFALVANDDAHSTHQIGGSYMETIVPRTEPQEIITAVRDGRVELHNPGLSTRRWMAGRLHQGLSMVASGERPQR